MKRCLDGALPEGMPAAQSINQSIMPAAQQSMVSRCKACDPPTKDDKTSDPEVTRKTMLIRSSSLCVDIYQFALDT